MNLRQFLALCFMTLAVHVSASQPDTLLHWGVSANVNPGKAVVMDRYQNLWQKDRDNFSFGAEVHYSSLPSDSDAFASDYGYPILSVGVKYSLNHDVTMHRKPHPEYWPFIEEVDYDSHMGNALALYGAFSRPFFRSQKWEADYTFNAGVGYSPHKYNVNNSIDNELIGSRWLIFFGAGLHLTYRIANDIGVKAGWEYWHLSNGALNRPNKGCNFMGPSLALVYYPYYEKITKKNAPKIRKDFQKHLYLNITTGIGAKTLNEDWSETQFRRYPDDPDYRTDQFKLYMCYSLQADLMYRYARRWASGAGVDVFYGTYYKHVADLEKANDVDVPHSPWSLGLSLKHQVFYKNLSLSMSLGGYVYREMGASAKEIEKWYYEKIGIQYAFPKLGGLALGGNVKAHLGKADYTEFVIAIPIQLR